MEISNHRGGFGQESTFSIETECFDNPIYFKTNHFGPSVLDVAAVKVFNVIKECFGDNARDFKTWIRAQDNSQVNFGVINVNEYGDGYDLYDAYEHC